MIELETELFKAISSLNVNKLSDQDKQDLLAVFVHTSNNALRGQLAVIFSDTHFTPALPAILEKIKDKTMLNYTGTLVFSLGGFELNNYLDDLIEIIVHHSFEAQATMYSILKETRDSFLMQDKKNAINKLLVYKNEAEKFGIDKDSQILIERTIKLLT